MKKIIIALAATTAFVGAVPAAAQYARGSFDLRLEQLQSQLQAGIQSGGITRSEATPLRERLREISQLERQFGRDGFTMQERTELQNRVARLREEIRVAARNGNDRYDRDNDDRYNDGRYGRDCPPGLARKDNGCLPPGQVGRDGDWNTREMIDRNRDGYDDRDLNRDGRIDQSEWRSAQDRYRTDGDSYDRDYDRDESWNSRETIDRNRDGYDDRDLNRDRRIDQSEWRAAEDRYRTDGGYDRDDDRRYDDRYEPQDTRRGGIGGIVDGILGRSSLRVGERVSANARLSAVPDEYRNQYRDGSGVYYRSDGRAIYQIDARTDVVLRIYALNR
jgi:hypothetical protein